MTRPLLLFILLCLPACGTTQPVPALTAGQAIKATAEQLTSADFSIDSLSRLMQQADTSVRMRMENEAPTDGMSGATYLFYTSIGDREEDALRASTIRYAGDADSVRATATFFIAGGYSAGNGKLSYERRGLHALGITDMEQAFGPYVESPLNRLRKESNSYTFSYRNPATGRKAIIDLTCVFSAKAAHNFVSTVTVTAY